MKSRDIEAAIKAGIPLAKKPGAHDFKPEPILELARYRTSYEAGWKCKIGFAGGASYMDKLKSGSIWTLADAETMCTQRAGVAARSVAARERRWAQQIADRDAARAACKLLEPHAPSARVAEGRVELSPEDATKLAGLLATAGST